VFQIPHCTGPGFDTKFDPGPRAILQRTGLPSNAGHRQRKMLQQVLQREYSASHDSLCNGVPTQEAKFRFRGCNTHTFSDQEGTYIKGMRL
jgi:hypothetical protein